MLERTSTNIMREERDSLIDIRKEEMLTEVRFRFTRYLNKIYWELYEEGELSEEAIGILTHSCDMVNDNPANKLHYWEVLNRNFSMEAVQIYTYFINTPLVGAFVARFLIQKIYFIY